MLIILAGITLNAVIGENGIIFQAKDTKNLVDNETKYDNEQLASLQNELKDNQLYSGIGIIPGTDQGGSSEGGENGTSGGNNQGGNQSGNSNSQGNIGNGTGGNGSLIETNTQDPNPGGGTLVEGKTDEDPKIFVVSGEEVAASFYQTDVTIQIYTKDKTKKVKYILSTSVTAITNELYPSGLVRELDIENGGTLTFTKDGEYTITAYAYDMQGNKSNPTIMWLKRQTGGTTTGGITVSVASGNEGNNKWYTSNVTLRVLGTNTGSSEVRYRVQGTATGGGMIGNFEVASLGKIDTGEVKIANGTTFRITADGSYTITAYDYDAGGMRISSSEVLNLNKDATRPVIKSYIGEQIPGSGFRVTVKAEDVGAGLIQNAYSYKHRISETNGEYTSEVSSVATKTYANLNQQKTYDMYVAVTDLAGNTAITDVIVRPSLYISNSPTAGETSTEGARSYYRSNVAMTLRGQDSNNADISKTTYQIIGTVTELETNGGSGTMDGTSTPNGAVLPANEVEVNDKTTKTIQLNANGNWTVKVRNYNKEGNLVTTNVYEITRDTIGPTISTFEMTSSAGGTIGVKVTANDVTSGLATKNDTYQYYVGSSSKSLQSSNTYNYSNVPSMPTLKVVVKNKAGITSEKTLKPTIYYLIDKVSVGDYVAYNAGTWSSTVGEPSSTGNFGGYTAGQNKGTSVISYSSYKAPTSGWRVFKKSGSGSSGTVTLISAGTPARGYYGNSSSDRSNMINALNSFCQNNFVNSSYASSARSMQASSTSSYDTWDGDLSGYNASSDLININSYYWLATAWTGSDSRGYYPLRCVYNGGNPGGDNSYAFGVRPIVSLKSGVKTNNTKDTSFLSQTCWAVK